MFITYPILLAGSVLATYVLIWSRRYGRAATAPASFLALQLPFLVGLLVSHDPRDPFDFQYVVFVGVGLIAFTLGAALVADIGKWNSTYEFHLSRTTARPLGEESHGVILFGIAGTGVIAGYLLVQGIGYHTFLTTVTHRIVESPDTLVFRDLRAQATRSSYVAAGYVAQFTVVLLPVVLVWLMMVRHLRPKTWMRWAIVVLIIAEVLFLTATGGRRPLIDFAAVLGIMLLTRITFVSSTYNRRRSLIVFGVTLLVAFGTMTWLQGRLSSSGPMQSLSAVSDELFQRLGEEKAVNELDAWRLLGVDSPNYGSEWLESLKIALPGPSEQQTLSSLLHETLFGRSDGNLPLSIWGSLLHNWGSILGLIWILLWGAALQGLTITVVRRSISLPAAIVGQILLLRLALPTDPYTLLLEGAATLAILWVLFVTIDRSIPSRQSYNGQNRQALPVSHLAAMPKHVAKSRQSH